MIAISGNSRKIIVDADACPVKREIEEVGIKYKCTVLMVASFDHRLEAKEGITVVQVDRSDQSVDLYIANRVAAGDILVTQDFGLATIGLAKKATVISNRGQLYSDETIDFLLASRHESAKKRRNGKHSKGPKPMTDDDRKHFLQTMTKILQDQQEMK